MDFSEARLYFSSVLLFSNFHFDSIAQSSVGFKDFTVFEVCFMTKDSSCLALGSVKKYEKNMYSIMVGDIQ